MNTAGSYEDEALDEFANAPWHSHIPKVLWWLVVVALVIPYLVPLVPPTSPKLARLDLSDRELEQMLQEVDPSVRIISGYSGRGAPDSATDEYDSFVTAKDAMADQLFGHLERRLERRLDQSGWRIRERGHSEESCEWVCEREQSRCRLYVWHFPLTEADQKYANGTSTNGMRIKLLSIGYTKSYGYWVNR